MGDEIKKYEYFIKLDASNIKDGTNIEKSIENYKKHTMILDRLREEEYEKSLSLLEENYKISGEIYTISQERDRLDTLIKLIETRIKQRNQTKKDYDKVLKPYDKGKDWFFKELESEIEIKSAQNLEKYIDKLKRIKIFIKRNEDIIALKEKNNNAEIALKDALAEKNVNDAANNILENSLNSFFIENFCIPEDLTTNNSEQLLEIEKIYVENIKLKEERILKKLNAENRAKPKDKTIKEKLKEERESVRALKTNHYLIKNKIRMLSLSSLIQTECIDYETIKAKRESILSILEDRENQIKKYRLQEDSKNYFDLGILVEEQLKEIKSQDKNNKLVKQLRQSITKNNDEIIKLEEANNEEEYQDILIEFASSYATDKKLENTYYEPIIKYDSNLKEEKNVNKLTDNQIRAIKNAVHNLEKETKLDTKNETLMEVEDIYDTPSVKYNKENIWEEPINSEEIKTSSIPVINFNQTIQEENNSIIENEKEYVPLNTFSEEESITQEENNLDSFIENETKEEEYNLDSFVSDEENNLNLDALIDETISNQENLESSKELGNDEGLDALIERAVPIIDKPIEEENNFANIVSIDILPDVIKNSKPRKRGEEVLKSVIEQLGLNVDDIKVKRRSRQ